MLTLDADQTSLVALGGVVLALLGLLVALITQLRIRRLRRSLRVLRGDAGDGDVLELANRLTTEVRALREQVGQQATAVDGLRGEVADGLRRVGVVRYDAFGDAAGRLSFSTAVLNDQGDGLVLTSIHSRGETRVYAKALAAGCHEQGLSPEEEQAISDARTNTLAGSAASR